MDESNGHGEKLSRKQEQAIAALLVEPTVAAAADSVGVNVRTLRNWMKRPDFESAYRTARREVVASAISRLQQAGNAAVDTLQRNLNCEQPAVEVRAALGILNHTSINGEMQEDRASGRPLFSSSETHRVECNPRVVAFKEVCHAYVMRQLELLSHFWKTQGLLGNGILPTREANRVQGVMSMIAYRFCINVDAWTQFCESLSVDPLEPIEDLPGARDLRDVEPLLRGLAFDVSNARTFLRRKVKDCKPSEPETADAIAQQMKDTFLEWP